MKNFKFKAYLIGCFLSLGCAQEKKESFDASNPPTLQNSILASGKCTTMLLQDVENIEVAGTETQILNACRAFHGRHLPGVQCEVPLSPVNNLNQVTQLKAILTSDYHSFCAPKLQAAGPRSFFENNDRPVREDCTDSFITLYERIEKWGANTLLCKQLRETYSRTYRCLDYRSKTLRVSELKKICSGEM